MGCNLLFKKVIINLLLIISILVLNFQFAISDDELEEAGFVYYEAIQQSSQKSQVVQKNLKVEALAAIVIDSYSGRVLFEKNAYEKRSIASTTKIMTAIVAIEKGNLEDIVTISKRSAAVGGSTINLKQGQKYKLRELLYGMMLNSGNDAAVAIAEHIGGSVEGFALLMNEEAKLIGAKNSCFVTPHGLDTEGQYCTAFDLALITKYALRNKIFSEIVKTKSAQIPGKSLSNTNEMLFGYSNTDGVKTGFTGEAGRCLVTSVSRGDLRFISVVLGCATRTFRTESSRTILDFAFNKYKLYSICEKDMSFGSIEVYKGLEKSIDAYSLSGLKYPLDSEEYMNLKKNIVLPTIMNAPVENGLNVGKIEFFTNDKKIGEVELYTKTKVDKKEYLYYLGDILKFWCKMAG